MNKKNKNILKKCLKLKNKKYSLKMFKTKE